MNNISIIENECNGCGICTLNCPHHAISIKYNSDGFLHPEVNGEKCISCGLCLTHCSGIKKGDTAKPDEGFIAIRKNSIYSSSGGVFYGIASALIEDGGYVVGCILDEHYCAKHVIINSLVDLKKVSGSKYVQSEVAPDVFVAIKELLSKGHKVLFSGTPCQCNALLVYLSCRPENLYVIDIICHGVPSPLFWKKDIEEIIRQKPDFDEISFRYKGYDERTSFRINLIKNGKVKQYIHSKEDPYYNQFMKGNSFRESCYSCRFANPYRIGDITIGDCATWLDHMNFYPHLPTSTVLLNSEKGKILWHDNSRYFKYELLDIEEEFTKNKQLSCPSNRSRIRNHIYRDLQNMNWEDFCEKYGEKCSTSEKNKMLIKHIIPVAIREKLRGMYLKYAKKNFKS